MRSMSTLSRLGEDIWVSALKLGSQASLVRPAQLWPFVGRACWLEGLGQSPWHPQCPPFFLLGRAIVLSWKKGNAFDHHSMGNSRQSMRVCSNVNFLTFLDVHLMWSLRIKDNLEAGGFYKRLDADGVRCATSYPRFFNIKGWLDVVKNKTWWTAD